MENSTPHSFHGFPSGKVRFTALPEPFFTELLGQVDSLNEMKLLLYLFWVFNQQEGKVRYLAWGDLLADRQFLEGLEPDGGSREDALALAIQSAVHRGAVLEIQEKQDSERYFLINTANSRAAVHAYEAGKWKPTSTGTAPISLDLVKPNIFQLYEQNIGPLTPLISEMLKLAEKEYPQTWIEDSMRIAVANNIRRWNYIEAILKSWQERGKDDENRRDDQTNYRRYIEGEFSRYIEH